MKKARKIRKSNKLILKLMIISIISVLIGIFYIAILSNSNKVLIKENLETYFESLNKLNYIKALIKCLTSNMITISSIWLLGISIIGVFLIIIILIIKSFALGFTISSLIYFYKLKGIIISTIYIIPLIINLFVIIILSYYGIIFSKNLNRLLFLKKDVNFKNIMRKYIKILLFSTICIIISSLIEIYIVPNILKLLQI